MDNLHPILGQPASSTKSAGFRPWFPYHSTEPCCEPVPHVTVKGLSISYRGRHALQDVTLEIPRGCITALIGPSGCGKTSFLMSLNRLTDLIPHCRVSGTVQIEGLEVLCPKTNLLELRRMVGMIFQKPTVFPFSIQKNLELPLREHGMRHPQKLRATIESILRQVGLWEEVRDRLSSSANALSGGQQQRLCLARALVLSPSVLLLDEPCSALDPLSGGVVEDLIKKLGGHYTIVIVTHNLAQARRLADHAAFFWPDEGGGGRLIEYGPAQAIFESPEHELTAAYISGARG